MKIVCFVSGKASAGKDTFVKCLAAKLAKIPTPHAFGSLSNDSYARIESIFDRGDFSGLPIKTLPMADAVRRELCRKNPGVSYQRLLTDYEYKAQFRKEMVQIGDGYRQTDSDIWVKKHWEVVQEENLLYGEGFLCIPDVRYKNELYTYAKQIQMQQDYDTVVLRIRVVASLFSRLSRMSPKSARSYCVYGRYNDSECMLDDVPLRDYDLVIDNEDNHQSSDKLDLYTSLMYKYRNPCEEVLGLWSHVSKE